METITLTRFFSGSISSTTPVKLASGPSTIFTWSPTLYLTTISCFSMPMARTSSSVRGMALLAEPTKPVTPRTFRTRCQVSSVMTILIST